MDTNLIYLVVADTVLFIHALFVAFVILGLLLVLAGGLLQWRWVRNRRFRIAHLAAIVIVVLQSCFSIICPLTLWEMNLREKAGDTTYPGSFVAHWLETLLYYRAPEWVFIVVYTVFGALVVASWFWVRPRP